MSEERAIVEKQKTERKRANELDGTAWLKYSISVWSDLKKRKEEIELKHPAMFPSSLALRLIECFTNRDARLILDPFAGIGSTLVAAKELGKDAVGIEISPEFAQIAENRVHQMLPFGGSTDIKVHVADSRELDKYVSPNSVDMVITSPPYWDILLEKRTADYKAQRDYGGAEADLGKIRDYDEFLLELRKIFEQVYVAMKPQSYCCVVVMDLRKKSRFYAYHRDVSLFMEDIGFVFDDLIIWNRGQEYNNLRPLGYPSVFRINKVHEFLLIFQKPRDNAAAVPFPKEKTKAYRTSKFIDINRAIAKDFEHLPGVGPEIAERIVAYREKNGIFKCIGDITKVKGIGPKTLDILQPHLIMSTP